MEDEDANSLKTRDFICACGKNYLSYAALFTHIKQKHDGKAPGPIVRPRSERKRGRPRKNPINDNDLRNSDSDVAKNGISIVNEINNNINSFQNKTKQAAQLLGCGQFQAFQAYRPESHLIMKSKSVKQVLKKPGFKRFVSQSDKTQQQLGKDESVSNSDVPGNLQYTKSAPAQNQDMNDAHSSYSYNFVIMHMKSLFENYEPTQQQLGFGQIIQIFDLISQDLPDIQNNKKQKNLYDHKQPISIQKGFKLFLSQIESQLEQFSYKQVSFVLSLLYEYISQQSGKNSNFTMLNLDISQTLKYLPSFINYWLPLKIKELSINCLHICKDKNPAVLLMSLCNWITLRESLYENESANLINLRQSFVNTAMIEKERRQINQQQINMQNQQKEDLEQSDQDLEFEELNHVLDQVRQARQIKLKNEMSILTTNKRIESRNAYDRQRDEDQQCELEEHQQSEQQYSLNSPECLKGKHQGENKMMISQR